MAAKTLATYISELSAGTSLGSGDKVPALESGAMVYFDGASIGGGGGSGITALTGEVTASGTGSVAATITAGLSAAKIADGTVSNTEFQYLNGVTSAIQTQLDAKAASSHTHSISDVTSLQTTLDGKQTLDATLTAFAGLTIAANSLTIGTGADTFSQTTFAANTFPARASTGSLEAKTITDFGLSLVDDADASTARTTLGIGSVENTAISTWTGSTNITTLGTIGTGTWNATEIGVTKGGTGLTALGSALQQLRVNAGGTALEYFTPSGSSGDISNGGNTTGAAVTIGTNDAFNLNFETNNVTRIAITGGASTGGAVTITNVNANTTTTQDVLTLIANSTGTPSTSYGNGLLFQGQSSTTASQDMVRLSAIWTTAIHASRTSALIFSNVTSAGSLTERFRFTPTAMQLATSYTIGGSGSNLTLGGGSGSVTISSSDAAGITLSSTGTNANTIRVSASDNAATSVAGINFGNATSHTQTSGTRNYINHDAGFAPTSGTAVHNQFVFSGTFNQTGGASGITRGIYLNQTLTAVADMRLIEIAANNANAKGVYQTGASTTNNFVGATNFGSTSAPNSKAIVEMTSTTKGFLPPRMTGTERDAITSPPAGLFVYNTTTNKLNFYSGSAWEAVTSA